MKHRFILGTANLGMEYGISNRGIPDKSYSRKIINHALSRGIDTFDTAAQYGVAEELLGNITKSWPRVKIITKIPPTERYTFDYVLACMESSLNKLNLNKIYGMMFHDPEIQTKNEIKDITKKLLELDKIEHIGFSGYSLDAVLQAKDKYQNWTIFEVPENVLDRRLKDSKDICELAASDSLFFIRSVFLQGLLLMKTESMPKRFLKYRETFDDLHNFAAKLNVSVLDLCLSYASEISWSSGTIIAAASIDQLEEILEYQYINADFEALQKLPIQVLDPRDWSHL